MKFIIATAIAVLALGSLLLTAPPTQAIAACPDVNRLTVFTYNNPSFSTNSFSWATNDPAPYNQAWLVERSTDGGATWAPVQLSTSRSYRDRLYAAPGVVYRFTGVTSAAAPCAPSGASAVFDPPAGGPFVGTIIYP